MERFSEIKFFNILLEISRKYIDFLIVKTATVMKQSEQAMHDFKALVKYFIPMLF